MNACYDCKKPVKGTYKYCFKCNKSKKFAQCETPKCGKWYDSNKYDRCYECNLKTRKPPVQDKKLLSKIKLTEDSEDSDG